MQLYDFNEVEIDKKLNRLAKVLKKDYGVDLKIYENLSYDELEMFLNDLENKKYQTVSESKFNTYYQDPEYAKTVLLAEAVRILLREISPKRKPKKLRPLVKESVLEEDKVVFSVDDEKSYNAIMSRYDDYIDWRGDDMVTSEKVYVRIEELLADLGLEPPKKLGNIDETLDYKVHGPSGVTVDHDIDEDEERPDLYWRKHQWEEERTQENLPVKAEDAAPAGEAYDTRWKANNKAPEELDDEYIKKSEKMDAYAQNQMPVGGTHENEQQAGVYVAIMNPNRFLDDDGEQKIMAIEPVNKSGNETSLLTHKVAPKMVDALEIEPEITEFEVAGNTKAAQEGKKPSKIIAVYEDEEKMSEELKLKGLSELVENTLLAEGELERAEITMASKDIVMRLQGMIEDLGKMGTDDIMPMVDGIRNNFGGDLAQKFSGTVEEQIQKSADVIQDFKNSMETFSSTFEKRISDEDVQKPTSDMVDDLATDMDAELPVGAELGDDDLDVPGDEDLGDELGGDEAAAGEEPLGRARKESRIVNLNGKKVKLTTGQIAALATAKKIMERVRTLGTMTNIPSIGTVLPVPTVIVQVNNKKVRLNEDQLKALIFAKKWKKRVDEKKANIVKLSESQAKKLMLAKKLTEKINQITENYKTGDKVKIVGGDHEGKKGTVKKPDVRGPNILVTVNGNDEYIPTKFLGKDEKLEEKKKPSAGLTKKQKSAVAKKAKAGKDIGKPGKKFEKVKKAAAKGGARDPEAVAAAAMWKNIPR